MLYPKRSLCTAASSNKNTNELSVVGPERVPWGHAEQS